MQQDEIIEMAREAGYRFADDTDQRMANHGQWQRNLLEVFAKLVASTAIAKERERASKVGAQAILTAVEKEREACAKVCKSLENNDSDWDSHHWNQAVQRCEYAIRARAQAERGEA